MEIHEAIADFSEDIVLAYLKQCSEAVGNLTSELTAGDGEKYGSSDDDEEEGEHTKGSSRTEEAEVFSVRVKDRAKSIDSGVCVDPRKAEQTENGEREKCRGNHSKSRESENSSQEDGAFSSLGACKCPDYEDSDEDWDKPKSLVMSFKKGDLFAVLLPDDATWWGVMSLRSTAVGYVPRSYLKFIDVRHLWLTTEGQKSSREVHMRALSELQSAASRLPHPGECLLLASCRKASLRIFGAQCQ
ncbi:uncharacterized protein LOC122249148 [Penaeus japonicus]|uniref:uncharacterized protein LOC122249148 n=1 Tax=Penaeus japonicus TaxID=27405 RepID=UPI001C7113ED|nr:uncharacterized protein LOC122249148 [Penaeus japonicus]